jgi:hypothetical protein
VVRDLQQAGWLHARAITGGWDAWQASGMPVEPRAAVDVN